MQQNSLHQRQVDDLTLGTINASLYHPVTVAELVKWFASDAELTEGLQSFALTTFLLEVPLETQVSFLAVHRISEAHILALAKRLSIGPDFPLAVRQHW